MLRTRSKNLRGCAELNFLNRGWEALLIPILAFAVFDVSGTAQNRPNPATLRGRSVTINTEPDAIIWINDIRRGSTDASGKLTIDKVPAGRSTLRVRANGFRELSLPLVAGRREVAVRLVRTTDAAELAFQQAETAREQARDDESRAEAAELYRRALKLRPAFPAARVGLARMLMELHEYQAALGEIAAARKTRPVYPEASAVEGRIYREAAFEDEAVKSFRRAIREGRGFQPEAHVGLARLLEERRQYSDAVDEYRAALTQLADSEPVIYQLLGAAYEKMRRPKEAVEAYETYLRLAPNGTLAPAIRSMLDQLKRDAEGDSDIPCC